MFTILIETEQVFKQFAEKVTKVRIKTEQEDPSHNKAHVLKTTNLKSTYIPEKMILSHTYLFEQLRKMKEMEEELNDMIGEESSVTKNLYNLHINMKNDIVK